MINDIISNKPGFFVICFIVLIGIIYTTELIIKGIKLYRVEKKFYENQKQKIAFCSCKNCIKKREITT